MRNRKKNFHKSILILILIVRQICSNPCIQAVVQELGERKVAFFLTTESKIWNKPLLLSRKQQICSKASIQPHALVSGYIAPKQKSYRYGLSSRAQILLPGLLQYSEMTLYSCSVFWLVSSDPD